MLIVSLERSDSSSLVLNLPETAKELTLSQKLDFDFGQMKVISFLKKHETNLFNNRAGYILTIAKGLSDVLQVDFADILNLKGVDLLSLSELDFMEHLTTLSSKVKGVNQKQIEKSLLAVWNHFSHVVDSAEDSYPEEIKYKGKYYDFPKHRINPMTGAKVHESLTVQQATQIIQYNNNYSTWFKNHVTEHGSEDDKGLLFTKYISEVAMILEDNIPFEDDAFALWMPERLLHWQDIDFQTVHSLSIWFGSFIDELKADPETKYFFESTHQASTIEEREAQSKAEALGRKIYQNVGIKTMIPALFEMNAFNNGASQLESVMKASFRQATKLISLNNARL